MKLRRRFPVSLRGCLCMAVLSVAVPVIPAAADNDVQLAINRLRRLVHRPVSPTTVPYAPIIRAAARSHDGIDPALLAALVRVESGFDPDAVSHKGAMGLMQLMPATARELGVTKFFDPVANLQGGADYLARQLRAFGSTRLALAAYNAGPSRVAAGTVPSSTWRYAELVQRIAAFYRRRGIP